GATRSAVVLGDAMTAAPSGLLKTLDVLDDAAQLAITELALVGGHRGGERFDDLGLGIHDRLADVVLVDRGARAIGEVLRAAERALPGRTDQLRAVGRVAG